MDHSSSLRLELKYMINRYEVDRVKFLLKPYCRLDEYAGRNGGYGVRSLYFDDYDNSALHDKSNGIRDRVKYRIRTYLSPERIYKFEIKSKFSDYTLKESAVISEALAEEVMHRRYGGLLEEKNNALGKVFFHFKTTHMMPVVLIDYWREPFVYFHGQERVRITIDSRIRSSTSCKAFFNPSPCRHPVLGPEKAVLEIKYGRTLPDFLKPALKRIRGLRTSFSKYALSRKFAQVYAFDL